jgi:hypothetical protein
MSVDYRLAGSIELLWHKQADEIMGAMFEHGSSVAEVDAVMDAIKPLFVQAYKPMSFAGSREVQQEAVRDWHFAQINTLLLEIIGREIELHRLRS